MVVQTLKFCKRQWCYTDDETVIKFGENLEFTVVFDEDCNLFFIENIKGDLEITKITTYDSDQEKEIKYGNNAFYSEMAAHYTFHITAKIESEEMCAVNYNLFIPSNRLNSLKLHQYFESEFVLPGYNYLKFTYDVRRMNFNGDENDIEIIIKNSCDVKIQGKKMGRDAVLKANPNMDVNLNLLFCFNPNVYQPTVNSESESRPESAIPSYLSNENSKLFKIASNDRFADVFFITSDETKIPSHRNILAECSNIFAQIFEESTEIPVKINVNDFSVDTIQSALNFINGKPDSFVGKEMEVFKFAVKYAIQDLIVRSMLFILSRLGCSNKCL
uniref:BTB domain-containing protein n=1 Tax=Panagrolaimus superbus TaxID=310955 RepID=A0A914XU28_9BILA